MINKNNKEYFICVGAVLVLSLGLLTGSKYILDILITTVYFCVIASSWNIMCGYAGQLSLGHVVFLGVGQYTSVLLYTKLGVSPWIGMFAGTIMAMLIALVVGILSLRLKSFYFSLSTIALATIMQVFAIKFDSLTGGIMGVSIPYKAGLGNMIFSKYEPSYFLFLMLLLIVLLTTTYLSKTRLGSNLIAIREDEVAAASLGINLVKSKVLALCISAFFTSLAGSLYAQYTLYIDPITSFNLVLSQKAAILTVIGGSGMIFGPLVGGLILGPTEILLRGWMGSTFQGGYLIVYGVLLIAVVLKLPNGILGAIKERIKNNKDACEIAPPQNFEVKQD